MVIWNLNNLYSQEEKQDKINNYKTLVEEFVLCKDKLNENISPERFIDLLKNYEELKLQANIIGAKTGLKAVEDISNQNYRKEEQELDSLFTELGNKTIFFMHFFKELSDKKAEEIINNSSKYKYFLTRARKAKKYARTEAEEQIINLKDLTANSLSSIRDVVVGKMRFPFQGKKLSDSEISVKVMSEKSEEREEAYKSKLSVYEDNKNVLGEVYKGICLDWYNEIIKIRKFSSSISSRNFSNALSDEVVNVMLSVIKENNSVFQEYFKIKSEILNYKNSRYHLYAPYNLENTKTYSYDYCKEKTLEIYSNFSELTGQLAKNIFDENKVHSDLSPNKRSGAFCYSYSKDGVPFVLLNHTDKLEDLQTMAHEIGHGIHGQLAKDKTEFTFHSSISLAEVASIFGELLLTDDLLKEANDEEKKYLLFHNIDRYYATIARQALFAEFEKEAHEQIAKGTTVDDLSKLFFKLNKDHFGKNMDLPESFANEWLLMPHIFNSPFYVYSYSFANLIVLALFNTYKHENKDVFVKKYLKILSAGGDADVVDILANAGFDITKKEFWEGAFEEVKKDLEELKTLIN
ncbi:MAG: M3 family metallopeptidase [Nanoarchaeota archaeon]|nr:M3 family metallopeptidase [Nanoarchaeota archaeon]